MSLEKVQSSRPMRIKAQTFNTILDAARVVTERSQRSGAGKMNPASQDSNIVLIKNDSGVDANRFDVLGIDGPIVLPTENLTEFENSVSFSCVTPTASTHEGKFVVLAEPIKAGEIGRAYAAGVTVAWVYMEYDGQVLKRADIRDGKTKLYPAKNGSAVVLWYEEKTSGTWGDTRAIIRFGDSASAGVWAQIITSEANGGVFSNWQEVELIDDGEGGKEWLLVANGLNGTNDGALYEVNGVENIPDGSIVQIFPNPTYSESSGLPAWLFRYAPETTNIGFGVPTVTETDAPYTNPYIELTVTDSAGTPILDDDEQPQTIKVWRNATRKALYTDFDATTVFTYVRFAQPEGTDNIGGCIFSRTEALDHYIGYKPDDGYSLNGIEATPLSTDITGDLGDENHVHVRGMMYMGVGPGGRAWRPWFVLDPDQLVANGGKIFTNGDDTTAGFLDDEIFVTPDVGHNWITKTITPGGENDNKLLLEHADWDAANTTTVGNMLAIDDAGPGITIMDAGQGQTPDEGTLWFTFKEYEDEYDGRKHSKIKAKAATKYLIIDPAGKTYVDSDDTGAGFLDDEIIVDPGEGADYWITKTVTPGGVADNKLLIEHAEWDDARGSVVLQPVEINAVGGGVQSSETQPGAGYAYIKWDFFNVSRDAAGHIQSTFTGPLYSKWVAVPAGSNPGDMMYWNGMQWDIVAAGGDQSLLHINGDTPAWFESGMSQSMLITGSNGLAWKPRGLDESIYITRSGELDWLSRGGDQSLLHVDGDALAWFESGMSQSMLITGSNGLAWKPKGPDESIYITRNGELDWFSKGGDKAILYVSGGNLSWLAGPASANQVLGGSPGWTGNMQWVTVVTDVRWNATTHQLEKKTRSIRVVDAGTESDWTAFATAVEGCSN